MQKHINDLFAPVEITPLQDPIHNNMMQIQYSKCTSRRNLRPNIIGTSICVCEADFLLFL